MLNKLLYFFKPFQMLIQRIGYMEPLLDEEEIERLVSIIVPGDTLGGYQSARITSKFIKGEYDHVAMVTENKDVIEAVGDMWIDKNGKLLPVWKYYLYRWLKRPMKNIGGVRRVGLRAFLYRMNHLFVARHNNKTVALLAANYATKIKGNYDYGFREGDSKWSCVEVCKASYKSADPKFMYGNKMPLPVHFLTDKDMTVIYDSYRGKKI